MFSFSSQCNLLFRNVLLLFVCIFPTVSDVLCKHGFVGSSVHMLAFTTLCSQLINTNIILLGFVCVFKIISSVNSVYIQPLRGILHSWIFWSLQIAYCNIPNHKLNWVEILNFFILKLFFPLFSVLTHVFSPSTIVVKLKKIRRSVFTRSFFYSVPGHKLPPSCIAICLY